MIDQKEEIMKVVRKIVLLLSCIAFFIMLSPANYLILASCGVLGILVGVKLGRRGNSRLKPVWLVVLVLISGYIAYSAGRAFYITWEASSQLKAILSRFTADTDSLLNILCNCAAAAAFPAVFALISLLFDYVRKIIPIIRDEYSIKPLFSGRSAFAKSAGIVILNLAAAILLGMVLLMGAYSLPVEKIDENVGKSAEILNPEGPNPRPYLWCLSKLDNYMDTVMLMEAADDSKSSALDRALMAYKGTMEGKSDFAAFISHYISGNEYTGEGSYSRYWHGYQIFLKPLLEIMDYGGIRILNGIVQVSLVILVSVLLKKRKAGQYILPYICIYLMINPLTLRLSLQFSSCFYLLTFGVITLLLLPADKRSRYAFLVFLNVGIFTAYFDYLTYPMAPFGIPAVIYIALQSGETLEKKLNSLIRCGITWCIGYGGMWASKWIVTYLLTGFNTIADAAGAFLNRTSNVSTNGSAISKMTCVFKNFNLFLFNPATILCAIFSVYLIMKIKTTKPIAGREMISASIPYVLLAFAPVVWYAFATQHSWYHDYFTNKAFAVTFMAILCCLTDLRSRASGVKKEA